MFMNISFLKRTQSSQYPRVVFCSCLRVTISVVVVVAVDVLFSFFGLHC